MLKYLTRKNYLLVIVFFVAGGAWAEQTLPSQEFWDYMLEYDDDNGELLDPWDYDQLVAIKNDGAEDALQNSADIDLGKNTVVNNLSAIIKSQPASSIQSSSSLMMKGETL